MIFVLGVYDCFNFVVFVIFIVIGWYRLVIWLGDDFEISWLWCSLWFSVWWIGWFCLVGLDLPIGDLNLGCFVLIFVALLVGLMFGFCIRQDFLGFGTSGCVFFE